MKKVKYSLLALLTVVSFSGIWSNLNAQIYSHPVHRTKFFYNENGDGIANAGGTATIDWTLSLLQLSSRGVTLLDESIDNASFKKYPDIPSGDENCGYLCDSYYSCSEEAEVVAGETLEIKGESGQGWSNAALYIDWDGNGVFDDHDLLQYNIYNESCNVQEEYHNANGLASTKMIPSWSIKLPNFAEERVVRFRIKYDEGVRHIVKRRRHEIYDLGVPGCSNDGHDNGSGPYDDHRQYFYSFVFNRFMPSANPFRGTTIDFDVRIKPNEFISQTIESKSIVSEVGAVVCESALGTAISDESGFEAFLNATSGNFYLANDITISSTLDVSQTVFGGIFDGNGYTITINPATTTKGFNEKSKNACFYPYGTNQDAGVVNEIRKNIATYDFAKSTVPTTTFPEKVIGGGFCGVLASEGVIKNVKVVYEKSCTYQGGGAALFGLVAGVVNGRVENVSIDIKGGSTVKVESNGTTVGACGGVTGVLFRGVVKNCAVNVNGTLSFGKNSGTLPRESALGGLIGRLQAGVVGSVKFSGNGTLALGATNNTTYSRYYIGGIAGMTNTPQGAFCGEFQYEWGYDNGTTGLDVNNVILSFTGAMDMGAANAGTTHNYYCRGLLFAEATDSTTVPNLITQYANVLTIKKSADANQSISGTSIPLISTTAGNCGKAGKLANTPVKDAVGKLYLYKDGRIPDNETLCAKYTNITTADTELNWAYEVQNIRDEAGNVTCVAFSTPYVVATYTGTNANIQGIEAASANVSDLGSAMVKIDPQPADVASPSWTWSETATPVTPDTDAPVCGGGGGTTTLPLLTYCTTGNQNVAPNGQRTLGNFTINGTTIAINEPSADNSASYRGYKNTIANAIEVEKGKTFTINGAGYYNWIHVTAFVDWDHDGVFEKIGRSPSADAGGTPSFTVTVPNDAAVAYTPLRLMLAYRDVNDACDFNDKSNPNVAVDIVLKVKGVDANANTRPATLSCTIPEKVTRTDRYLTSLAFTGDKVASLSSGTIQQGSTSENLYHDLRSKTLEVQPGEVITTTPTIGNGSWVLGYIYVDWNNDGDFSDSGEYMAGPTNVGDATPWWTPPAFTIPNTVVPGATYTMRYTADWNYNNNVDRGANYPCGRTATTVTDGSGNFTANNGGCMVDFELKIKGTLPPAASGDGCAYVANFGDVYVGDVVTYDISLGAGSGASIHPEVPDDEYTLNYNDATGMLTVTYNVPATPGAVAVDSIGGITKDGDVYRIAVSATVKPTPTVTFRIGEDGGGLLSLDMGKTTSYLPYEFNPYKGQLLTAVPQGPCAIEGWYVSTDGGTTFNAVGHTNPDYTYTGADDAIVEVRFKFEDFEGDFGNSRFTVNNNNNLPFYISSITTTGGIVNVAATDVFTPATVVGGSAHLNYLTDQRLQTLTETLGAMSHDITVTVENADKIPTNARLLCFIDYNYNGWFDFTSSADGLASGLSRNNELVYVGVPNGNASQTFTFTITNDNPVLIDKYGKTRMRFMVATYVDMYGLGPVNQYGNYQPRLDTDGDGIADTNLPLNDNNGSLYTPNNECRYENYINVADVNFEVVAYIRSNDKYEIRNGESIRLGDLYIESVEDETGINSGKITFDKSAPYGSLSVEGNIIVRKRIYQDRWHDVAFPIAMQGTSGDKGVCAVAANSSLQKLPDDKWLLKQFNPAKRNEDGGYGKGLYDADKTKFAANTFYEFAADNVGGATLGNLDGTNYYWIQFHSVDQGFFINPSSAKEVTIPYTRDQESSEYNNRNVFTLHNPYLSPINVREITTSPGVGWENITWWNAARNGFVGVSAANSQDMPPYFGYWVQFTEDLETTSNGDVINVVLGDVGRQDYAYPDDGIVSFAIKSASATKTQSFDTPDAYTLGIDRATTATNKNAISSTIVTLTDAGSIDEFRAGYDMPVSYAATKSTVPEIWSKAGSSRMMFNDVMRGDEVVVPVGIRIKEAGEYVVRLTHTNHSASLVQLYDKVTGSKVDLQRNEELLSYSFLAEVGDDERFELIIIAPNAMTDLDVIESDEELAKSAIYNVGSTLRLVNLPLGYSVAICDVVGRELLQTAIVDTDMQLQLPSNQGVYLVNVRNEKGNSVQVVKLTR